MDIVPKIQFAHLKGNFETLTLKQKLFLLLFMISLTAIVLPQATLASLVTYHEPEVFVFDMSDSSWQDTLDQKTQDLNDQIFAAKIREQALKHAELVTRVQEYLHSQGSPLAEYAETLVSLRNWKKIVALANAESSLCEKYPVATANCWGVGGSDLLDFGDNLGEGVVSMNHFLNANPRRSPVKYASMNFDQMNGLYKQPARQHWVDNNLSVYDELTAIEKSLN